MPKKLDKKAEIRYALRHGEDVAGLQRRHHTHSTSQISRIHRSVEKAVRGWSFCIASSTNGRRRPNMTATKFSLGVIAASVLVLIAGCGGGGDSTPTLPVIPADTQAPTVLADQVVPAVGSTVARRALKTTLPFSEALNCFTGEQAFEDKGITGKAVCKDRVVTLTFDDAPLVGKTGVTATLSNLTDLAGNKMVPFTWTYQLQADLASVSLSATPDTVVAGAGTQVTLAWTTTNAVNCLASGGWNGSLTPAAGGSQTVTPTVTTTYSAVCYNSANIATPVVSTTVTVTPAPAKLEYTEAVLATWQSSIYRIDRSVPAGYLPNMNSTGKAFYFVGLRSVPRADCLVEASGLDNTTGVEYKLLYNPKTGEYTNDTSVGGAIWNRFTDYVFATPWDPSYPLLALRLQVTGGTYEVRDGEVENVYFRNTAGVVTSVVKSTFAATGGFKRLAAYSCKAQ